MVQLQELFKFQQSGVDDEGNVQGQFVSQGVRPRCTDRIVRAGVELPRDLFGIGEREIGGIERVGQVLRHGGRRRRTRQALGDTEFKQAEASGRDLPIERVMTDVRAWLSAKASPA